MRGKFSPCERRNPGERQTDRMDWESLAMIAGVILTISNYSTGWQHGPRIAGYLSSSIHDFSL